MSCQRRIVIAKQASRVIDRRMTLRGQRAQRQARGNGGTTTVFGRSPVSVASTPPVPRFGSTIAPPVTMTDLSEEAPWRHRMSSSRPTLNALVKGRENNFQLLRFCAASAVVFFHFLALTNHWTDEPLWRLFHDWDFGTLGVQIFFVISGFLVAKSWCERANLPAFLAARALRIYPALILAVLFTVVLAGISTSLPWSTFLRDPITTDFIWHTASGWDLRDELPGAFATNPYPRAVNGSLWTLPVELRLYLIVAAVGTIGLIARRTISILAAGSVIAAALVWPDWLLLSPNDASLQRVVPLFALGSLAWVVRQHLPISLPLAIVAGAIVLINPQGLGRGVLFGPLFTYLVLTIALHPRVQWSAFNKLGDYSYGIYVYSFPLQQLLVQRNLEWRPEMLFAVTMVLVIALAALSWHGVERPLLGLKRRLRRPTSGLRVYHDA
jgi:peptidoglycan/LPS O-acetylase OafA/YrhL